MTIDRYVGRVVDIVYMDRKGKITQRRIDIKEVVVGASGHTASSRMGRACSPSKMSWRLSW